MGNLRQGPPSDLVLVLKAQLEVDEFVETGTFQGNTAAWAVEHFSRVMSIELSPAYHAAAQARFRGQSKVRLACGNSGVILQQYVPTLNRPALFWLDAHWSGGDTAGEKAECPLLDELAAINDSAAEHVVLVDDARLFCLPPPKPHRADHWPSLVEVVNLLAAGGRRHVVIFEDVFVALPMRERVFLAAWLQNRAAAPAKRRFGWLSRA